MKKVKYLISTAAILISFIIIGEYFQLYLDTFETEFYNTSLYLTASPSSNKEDMIKDILDSASKNSIEVFTIKTTVKNSLYSERCIFGTSNVKKIIGEKSQVFQKQYPSLLFGSKKVMFKNFIDLKKENLKDLNEYYLIGEKNDIFKFKKQLLQYAGALPHEGYASGSIKQTLLVWTLVSLLILFLSFYEMTLQKKENILKIFFGEDSKTLILKSIVLDAIVYSLIFIFTLLFLKKYTNILFHIEISIIVFIIMLIINSIMHCRLLFYDFKKVFSNITISRKMLCFNYILKCISTIIVVILVSSNFSVIYKGLNLYRQKMFFENHRDYSYVKLGYPSQYNTDNEKDTMHNNFMINDLFYRKFFNDYNATALVRSGLFGDNVILANKHSLNYLKKQIPILNTLNYKKQMYFIIPEKFKNDNLIDNLKKKLEISDKVTFNYTYEVIYYKNNTKVLCIDEFDVNGSSLKYNPIIVFNNIDMETLVNSIKNTPFHLDYAYDILYKISDKSFNKFTTEHSKKHKLYSVVTNAYEKYMYELTIVKRAAYINLFLSILFLILESIIIKLILRLQYEVNAIELSIKKILGYNLLERNKKLFIITIIPTIVISLVFFFVGKILKKSIICYGAYGALIVFIIELLYIIYYINKFEKSNIQRILKGGKIND